MSNIFKSNSRFAALAEDAPFSKENKKNKKNLPPENLKVEENNSFKSEGNSFKKDYERPKRNYEDRGGVNYYTNRYSKENQEKKAEEEKLREEEKKRIKEENLAKAMSIENFPSLISNPLKEEISVPQKNYISFAKKISTEKSKKVKEIEDPEFKNLKPGWCIIKKDPLTNKTIMKTKEIFTEQESKEDNSDIEVLNALIALHEKRTAEYIELYGYDTWEKMFRSPTWDYDYFDRLDREYEEEMERLQEEEDSREQEEYSTDYDKHNNYWKY